MADFDWIIENYRIKPTELSIYKGRLKSKKQPEQPVFLSEPLTPTASRPLSRGRELERGQQAARLVSGRLGYWERLPQFGECPLPSPPPRGRGQVAAGFAVAGGLKSSLDLPLISGRLKNKKQPVQPIFLAEPLIPTATRPLSRGRELERGQQAARLVSGRLGYWERLPQFGECPLPSPPPRGRERVAAGFTVTGGLKSNLNLRPLIAGRLKSKKQPAQPIFLAKPLIPTASPSPLS